MVEVEKGGQIVMKEAKPICDALKNDHHDHELLTIGI